MYVFLIANRKFYYAPYASLTPSAHPGGRRSAALPTPAPFSGQCPTGLRNLCKRDSYCISFYRTVTMVVDSTAGYLVHRFAPTAIVRPGTAQCTARRPPRRRVYIIHAPHPSRAAHGTLCPNPRDVESSSFVHTAHPSARRPWGLAAQTLTSWPPAWPP